MQSYQDIARAASALPWDQEGYVVYDKDFNRCKIKSPKYVVAHFARSNEVIARRHLIDIILMGEVAEFLIYAPEHTEQVKQIKDTMKQYLTVMDGFALKARDLRTMERAEAAQQIKSFPMIAQPIIFFNYNKDMTAKEYTATWDAQKWDRVLDQFESFQEEYK